MMFRSCTLIFYIPLLFTLGHDEEVPFVYILLSSPCSATICFLSETSVPLKGTVTGYDAVHDEEYEIYNIDVATGISLGSKQRYGDIVEHVTHQGRLESKTFSFFNLICIPT